MRFFFNLRLVYSLRIQHLNFFYTAAPYNQHVSAKCPQVKICVLFLLLSLRDPKISLVPGRPPARAVQAVLMMSLLTARGLDGMTFEGPF